ncbi:DUF6716 putative glycosyltransferase [Enterovibrio norvegicus]|uniref:DUF6716 putative glycosyltransferase n=1 Tax=Enterovibrio norvegicus TaxID=188144 RepID=UPI000C856BB4|nr:DUF6716 putative glycosyltransferase [Enterovibrio norvegicus]PMI30210.1 hypothetical protein BCU47_18680 [Enterovibrio norvegicus]
MPIISRLLNKDVYFYGEGDSYVNAFKNVVSLLGVNSKGVNFLSTVEEVLALKNGTLFLGLGGVKLNLIISKCQREDLTIVTYFPGIIHMDAVLSIFSRASSDVVILPNKYSYDLFRKVQQKLSFNCSYFVLPYLLDLQKNDFPNTVKSERSLFIEQSIVPASEQERHKLILILFEFAKKHPSRELIILVRDSLNSPHAVTHCIFDIIDKFSLEKPHNVNIVCGSSSAYINYCDHVISCTSTVVLDAAFKNKSISILPLRKPYQYGQDLFFDTGLITEIITPTNKLNRRSKWFENHIFYDRYLQSPYELNKKYYDFPLSFFLFLKLLACNFSLHFRLDSVLVRSIIRSMKFAIKYNKIHRGKN